MFKIAGIILAFIASSLIGFYKAYEVKRRRDLLIDFQELILHISTEMSYFKEPLPLIFQRVMKENNLPANVLLRQCYLKYQQDQGNMALIWQEAVENTYQNESLTAEDLQIFNKCGTFLGQSDFTSQEKHFRLLQNQLEKQIKDADEAVKTKGQLYGKAGISIGAVIAIAFI